MRALFFAGVVFFAFPVAVLPVCEFFCGPDCFTVGLSVVCAADEPAAKGSWACFFGEIFVVVKNDVRRWLTGNSIVLFGLFYLNRFACSLKQVSFDSGAFSRDNGLGGLSDLLSCLG